MISVLVSVQVVEVAAAGEALVLAIFQSKHKRGKAERFWRTTQLNIHHQLNSDQCRHVGKFEGWQVTRIGTTPYQP